MALSTLFLFLPISASLETSTHYYRLQAKDQETISPCKRQFLEKDGLGREWPKYCYQYSEQLEETVEFLREVGDAGWTYVVSAAGEKRFDYRIPLHIQLCEREDIDGKGKSWSPVCYSDGRPVLFQRSSTLPWTYLQGSGCHLCSDRRIIYQIPLESQIRFLEKPETLQNPDKKPENNCIHLEFDTSGRGFSPDFTPKGVQITYIKDVHGNYVWSSELNHRIIGFPPFTELKKPSEGHLPCLIDPSEAQFVLEIDQYFPFYWRKDPEKTYLQSETDIDKAQGMYRIAYDTGLRLFA